MKGKEDDVLIIPDIHGRKFWESAYKYTGEIVFLGDYLDPYEDEEILPYEAFSNFEEITAFAKDNGRVTLLIGNHDLHYLSDKFHRLTHSTRYNQFQAKRYGDFFRNNANLFHLSHELDTNGKKILFTHAGVTSGWWQRHQQEIVTLDASHLNRLLSQEKGIASLAEIGSDRGGDFDCGSPVWADVSDMMRQPFIDGNLYQIFGHTKITKPLITPHFACIDCRKPFWLSEILHHFRNIFLTIAV